MNNKDHVARLRKMMRQVNPEFRADDLDEQVESLRSTSSAGDEQVESAIRESHFVRESLDILRDDPDDENVDKERQFLLEAIVMPYYRPVIDIIGDKMQTGQLTSTWQQLGEDQIRSKIEGCFPSVGRIDAKGVPYGGTGFVVGDGLIMTNRHVALLFAQGVGTSAVTFQDGHSRSTSIDFYHELGQNTSDSLTIEDVLMVHPYWDMALLKVGGLDPRRKPLLLSVDDPASLAERSVVVVGYPGFDPYGDDDYQRKQNRVFRGTYSVKRMQPGLLKERELVESYEREVNALTHDCSTLGGNSGSAVLMLPNSPEDPIEVVGLHFAGAYLHANYAVPTIDLAQDSRVVGKEVNFAGETDLRHDFYRPLWESADDVERPVLDSDAVDAGAQTQATVSASNNQKPIPVSMKRTGQEGPAQSWTIPLHISVSFGAAMPTSMQISPPIADSRADTSTRPRPTKSPEDVSEEWLFSRPTFPEATYDDFDVESLAAESFDWNAALSTALASKLVYEDGDAVRDTCRSSFRLNSVEFIAADATECFVASSENAALVCFRGTQGFADWMVDLDLLSTRRGYGTVHRGFLGAFKVVEDQLANAIQGLGERKLIVTGHSLGGALATIAAAEWQAVFPISWVYTFGQPAVGKGEFVDFMGEHYSRTFIRFVNDDDIIARVPPTYRHFGRLCHFDARGNLKVEQESLAASSDRDSIMTELEFDQFRLQLMLNRIRRQRATAEAVAAVPEGLLSSAHDHSMVRYIEKIAKKVRSYD